MTSYHSSERSVLLLVASNRRRGAEVFGETLAGGLQREGWRVAFASLAAATAGPTVSAEPLSTKTPATLPRLDPTVVAALRDRAREFRPSIVLANGSSTMQYAIAAMRHWRTRPRLVYVSIGEPMWWIRSRRHRILRTAILKGVDRVFSVSATTAQQLVDNLGVAPGKLRIAPTGVPDRFFEIERERLDDEEGPLRVVFVGNLSAEKGPLTALQVITLAAERSDIVARFLGDGPQRSELERAARDTAANRVEVLGSVADVAPHLAWADVLLMTSLSEGLPGVPLEAGAAGVGSVVFDVGGSRETVVDGESGFVVAPGDVAAAAAALRRLAGDRLLVRTLGAAARSHVAANYRLGDAVARYIELLGDELTSNP